MKKLLVFCLLWGCAWAVEVQCSFARGKWESRQWKMVHTFRWEAFSFWVQEDGCIRNVCPTDCTPADLISKRAPETYVSMVWSEPVKRDGLRMSATMSFEDRMAPELVLMPEPVKNAKGELVANEYWEVVLYDQGINVWHLKNVNGKAEISRVCFVAKRFMPQKNYKVEARIIRHWTGKSNLQISCDGMTFGCQVSDMPEKLYAGITGCEGVVRFFDFSLKD